MIELIYVIINVPVVMMTLYILFNHKATAYSSDLKYNYSYFIYMTLSVWWIILSVIFMTPTMPSSITDILFAGETLAELISMMLGYTIITFLSFLAAKELQLNFGGIFRTPTQEVQAAMKKVIYKQMISKEIKAEINKIAKEEFEMQKENGKSVAAPTLDMDDTVKLKDMV